MTDAIPRSETSATPITRLLRDWQGGNADALGRLVPLVYDELYMLASRQAAREWRHDRPQTTLIVNEAYLRLSGQRNVDWQNRGQFFALASQLMRRILVDHVRRNRRQKRGGGVGAAELDELLPAPQSPIDCVDAIDLDRALARLEQLDPDRARIVEMRFFGGLTVEETAAALGISPSTVKREWALAKGWLHRELTARTR